jgi:hypothetical protein
MAVPICPFCKTPMEFRWEPFIHDRTVRAAARLGAFLPLGIVAWDGWALRSFHSTEMLLAWLAIFLAVVALGSRPVVRCDGCAYTVDGS